jgi:cobalt-zinc-cadmium efflux system membrane fusion protein
MKLCRNINCILIFAFSSFLIALLYACSNSHADEKKDPRIYCLTDSLLKMISLDTVKTESVMDELTFSGKITFDEEKVVKIYPLASGHVQEVNVTLGDYVKAGQLLALVKSADVAGILSDAVAAKNDLAIAKKNLDVTQDLYKSGLSSEKDYLTAQNYYGNAQATFTKTSEILKIYASPQGNLSGYYIKAPISGFIVERKINPGMEIRSDAGDNLLTISDLKDVWALANVYESDIDKIKLGYRAKVTSISYPDRAFFGKIDKIYNVLNPETKVMNIRIRLDNADYSLKPGMFAKVNISYVESKKMLTLSSASILFDNNRSYVVKYGDKCNIQSQPVNVYKSWNSKSYFNSDSLREGDKVIGVYNLYVFTALKHQ